MNRSRSGLSFLEMVLAMVLLGILAAFTLPRIILGAVHKQQARALARQLTADLRYTRQLALTHAAENAQGFELVLTGSSPWSGYEIRNRATSEVLHSFAIDPAAVQCTGGREFGFGSFGNLLAGSDTAVQVSSGDRVYTISVIGPTGAVRCQSN